jgi:hypothetical protein
VVALGGQRKPRLNVTCASFWLALVILSQLKALTFPPYLRVDEMSILTKRLAHELAVCLGSLEYAADVIQAPAHCAMRENIANGRKALAVYKARPEPTLQEAAAALIKAMEREMTTATPGDKEWLRRTMGNIRKMAQ